MAKNQALVTPNLHQLPSTWVLPSSGLLREEGAMQTYTVILGDRQGIPHPLVLGGKEEVRVVAQFTQRLTAMSHK